MALPISGEASLSANAHKDASLEAGQSSQIYVSNLSLHTTDESLKSNFEQFGTVVDVKVQNDPTTGKPKGYAYVTMSSASDAETAIKHADGEAFDGRTLKVSACTPRICGQGAKLKAHGTVKGETVAPKKAPVSAKEHAGAGAGHAATSVSAKGHADVSADAGGAGSY